jgi:hypothetical protein
MHRVGTDRVERGLLGLALSPDVANLYVDFTGRDGDTRIEEYPLSNDGVHAGSARLVLRMLRTIETTRSPGPPATARSLLPSPTHPYGFLSRRET